MIARNSEVFIIDSDSLIVPYRSFYTFSFAPNFWSFIENKLLSNKIMLLDMVYDEINVGNDELSNWLQNISALEPINHRDSDIIKNYGDVLNYIQDCGYYKTEALNDWSNAKTADPWLIATAMVNHYTIITFERSNGSLNKVSPSKNAKIPDICKQFNVPCKDLYYMMDKLSFNNSGNHI
ncbi:hypothetical protein AGMMS50268_09900 [Spirochaetia bacterium]|nr:hypothetical protein AGMMS50268_09900 [Spirochaetia bacterium]